MGVQIPHHAISVNPLTAAAFVAESFPQEIRMLARAATDEMDRRVIRPDVGQFMFAHYTALAIHCQRILVTVYSRTVAQVNTCIAVCQSHIRCR